MAIDLTLLALATVATSTLTEDKVQPRPADTITEGTPADLGDNRSVSAVLAWEPPANFNQAQRGPVLRVALEAADATNGPWEEVYAFAQVNQTQTPLGNVAAGFTSPRRYLRARSVVSAGGCAGSCRFSVTGRAYGSAT